jgi:hypothetical protein
MTLVQRAASSPLARSEQLHRWGEEALKRFATVAAAERDPERLWRLT